MCREGETVLIRVSRSVLGRYEWKENREVDSCIADLAQALEQGGIEIKGSCCRHGEDFGVMVLQDGRMLMICDLPDYRSLRWAVVAGWQVVRNGIRRWLGRRQ